MKYFPVPTYLQAGISQLRLEQLSNSPSLINGRIRIIRVHPPLFAQLRIPIHLIKSLVGNLVRKVRRVLDRKIGQIPTPAHILKKFSTREHSIVMELIKKE